MGPHPLTELYCKLAEPAHTVLSNRIWHSNPTEGFLSFFVCLAYGHKRKKTGFPEVFAPADQGEQVQTALCIYHSKQGNTRTNVCVCVRESKIVTIMVTCPVVALDGQGWSQEVGVHWLGAILSHLLLWGHVRRRGSLCIRKE